jgi:hypothetical protein
MRIGRHRRRWVAVAAGGGVLLAAVAGWGAYAAVTWLGFGPTRSGAAGSDPLMDRYLPRYDIAEVHRTRVAAPAAVTYEAARRLDLQQSGVIHAIFRGRELMLRSTAPPRPRQPLVSELRSLGWGVLEEVPGRQVVLGSVTQPWKADVAFGSVPRAAYADWDTAGYVKIVVTLAVDSLGLRESEFRTETRALATDAESRAKFRRYWAVFSPGILLIRTQALQLVRRDAERSAAERTAARR